MLDEISREKRVLKSSAVIMFFKVLGLASALFLDILIAARFGLAKVRARASHSAVGGIHGGGDGHEGEAPNREP